MADELDLVEGISNLDGTSTGEPLDPAAEAEHDAWFRAEVRKAIKIADDPTTVWISNDEVKRQMAPLRLEWQRKIAEEEASR